MKRTADPSFALLDRLKHAGRQLGLPAQTMLLLYAQQGLLARLDASAHAQSFVLKGGLSLFARYASAARPTQDVDLAAHGLPNTPEAVAAALRDVLGIAYPDGLTFDPATVRTTLINEGLQYPGVGARFVALAGRARQPLQVDVTFGNVITPAPVTLTFPRLLLPDAVPVRVYPLETVIAEKFAALAELGLATTRMKDVYDLHVIASRETFDAQVLTLALTRSFTARGTRRTDITFVLTDEFASDPVMASRWAQFLRRTGLDVPAELPRVMPLIRALIGPLLNGKAAGLWAPEVGVWQ